MAKQKKTPKQPTSVVVKPLVEKKIERLRAVYGFNRLVNAGLLAASEMDRDALDTLILRVGADASDEFEADVRAAASQTRRQRGDRDQAAGNG
jgi:hypothetical protein